jgi:hypothetical protein
MAKYEKHVLGQPKSEFGKDLDRMGKLVVTAAVIGGLIIWGMHLFL